MYKRAVLYILCTMILLDLMVMAGRAERIVRVSYLGPAGTYTEEAAQFFFQGGEALNPKETVNDAIADLLSGEADYAVIPQENTVGGAVVNYVDALIGAEDAFCGGRGDIAHQPDPHGRARRNALGYPDCLLPCPGPDPECSMAVGEPT